MTDEKEQPKGRIYTETEVVIFCAFAFLLGTLMSTHIF